MKKRIFAISAICLLFMLYLSVPVLAWGDKGTIKLTLIQKTDTTNWGEKKVL